MKIIGIGDNDTIMALRLAGIKELYTPDGDEVSIWNKIIEKEDIGIIIITENIADKIGNYIKDFRNRNTIPLIIEIPDKKGRKKDHIDYISHLIKKAVGVEVKKK